MSIELILGGVIINFRKNVRIRLFMVNFFKKWAYLGGVSVIFFNDLGGVLTKNAIFRGGSNQY